jgi:hypothetical protein
MRSYFVRHTERLLIRDEDLRKLWEEDRIAIHYPTGKFGIGQEDSRSLNPKDYNGKRGRDRTAISRLVELASDGGYVWTESFVSEGKTAKAGYVEPGTTIELRDAQWYLRGRDVPKRKDGDPAVLKTVKLTRVKAVRWFSGGFWSLQNSCKQGNFVYDAFLNISGYLLGLLHGCCTNVAALASARSLG